MLERRFGPKKRELLVGVFEPTEPQLHVDVLRSFTLGLEKRNVPFFVCPLGEGYRDCDVAVTFGIGKKRTQRGMSVQGVIESHALRPDTRHLVIERGFVRREEYFMVGWDGLNGRADFCNRHVRSDRWKALDIIVKPWRTTGSHILLCGQVPWDSSVQHTDHLRWCRLTAQRLRRLSNRPIVFRPHPCSVDAMDLTDLDVVYSKATHLEEDLSDAWAVVTYSSNSGVEAAIAGVPAFAFDKGAMGYSILNHDLSQIESPIMPDRKQWLDSLAYTQWTQSEMAQGLPWIHLWENQNSPWDKCRQKILNLVDLVALRSSTYPVKKQVA